MYTITKNVCRLAYMKQDSLIPVDLEEFRAEIGRQGTALRLANSKAQKTRDALKATVLAALASGMSELEASKVAGVARVTVRQWAGK